ncbi:zinc finger protein 410 isoform X2 [Folsomia candida]|uniref:zinc finger protein 410 isoform X2 n=1 Tax=Folsomia candida TaxID=158441 RepID=UPI001604BC3D|nr:zinc finger protein 410 isoform X2 [Folsomia candida]
MEPKTELGNLNPIVRLSRDDRVEIAVAEFISRHHTYCFLCSTSIQDSTPISARTANRIAICKSYFQDINPISFKNEGDIGDNIEDKACRTCLIEVEKVWMLNEGIIRIKQQIASILTKANRQWHRPVVVTTAHSNLVKNPVAQPSSRPCIKIETESINPKENGIYIANNIFVGVDDDNSSDEVNDSAVMSRSLQAEPTIVTNARRKQTLFIRNLDFSGGQGNPSPNGPVVKKSMLVKKLKCYHCDKTYFARTALTRHVRSVHDHVRYPCSVCGKKLISLRNRITHEVMVCKVVYSPDELKAFGTKIYTCEVQGCGKLFPRLDDYSNHMKKHAYQGVDAESGGGGDNLTERGVDEEEEMGEILNRGIKSPHKIKIEDDATMEGEMLNEYALMSPDGQVIESSYTEPSSAVDIVSNIFIGGPPTLDNNSVCNVNP